MKRSAARRSGRRCRAGRRGRCLSTSIRRRPFARELVEQRLDERGLAGAARAGEQHVVGGLPFDELARVLLDQLLLVVDAAEVVQSRMRCTWATGSIAARPLLLRQRKAIDAFQSGGGAGRGSSDSSAIDAAPSARVDRAWSELPIRRASAAVVRVDADVVVREVARPHRGRRARRGRARRAR